MEIRDLKWEDFHDVTAAYYQAYEERERGEPIGIHMFDTRPSVEDEVDWFVRLYKDVLKGRVIALVAETDGHAIGLCTVGRPGPPSEVSHVGVLGILVRAGHRGKGAGEQLVRTAIERAKEKFEIIELTVLSDNAGARRLYERLGFRAAGSIPRGQKRGDRYQNVEHMVLDLR